MDECPNCGHHLIAPDHSADTHLLEAWLREAISMLDTVMTEADEQSGAYAGRSRKVQP